MKKIISFLQNPILKIFAAPLAFIAFGLIVGMAQTQYINWLDALLLAIIAIASQLITHFFHVKYDQKKEDLSDIILYICEAIFIVATIILMLRQHWIIGLLLAFYIVYIHVIYFPYNISNTVYDLLLSVFYKAFILNIIAYYTQINATNTTFLMDLIPILVFFLGIELEIIVLKNKLSFNPVKSPLTQVSWLNFIIVVIAIILGFIQSLPSTSYYITQIIYLLISGVSVIPMIVKTSKQYQMQNKINYFSTIALVFTVMYALSTIF